jgi:hypothetical protein
MNRHPAQPALPAICAAIALVFWTSFAGAQADAPPSAPAETPAADSPAVETLTMEQDRSRAISSARWSPRSSPHSTRSRPGSAS